MSASIKPKVINVEVIRGKGALPGFLALFHHHFEKSKPLVADAHRATLVAPIDQLHMAGAPSATVNAIESITVSYERRT